MNTENPIRIMSVDDHPLIRQGIAGLASAQADLKLVAEATNGREAVQQFRRIGPDVTLVDLQMPEMSGRDSISAIRGEFPDARIVVLTTYAGTCAGASRRESGRPRLSSEGHASSGTRGDDQGRPRRQQTLSPEVSFQLDEHFRMTR